MEDIPADEIELFTFAQERQIIEYIEERFWNEFTQTDFQNEIKRIENIVEERCKEIDDEMVFEMFKMKKELEEQFNMKANIGARKWWKLW